MKKLTLITSITINSLLPIAIGITINIFSQPCLPEGITFTTQAQIDSFQINYPGCTEIEGFVEIGDEWPGSDITDLNDLSVLTSINGNLKIGSSGGGNPNLISLEGLGGLISIGGDLTIYRNDALNSLVGLEGVTSIGGDIDIVLNDALTSLTGLEGLTNIQGNLFIGDNDALTSLTGLEGLNSIGGDLEIKYNNVLTNLIGMESMTSIMGKLWIYDNYSLTSLSGLEAVNSIGDDLDIDFNNTLTSLTGLEGLSVIGGDVIIEHNDALTSLTGLEGLISIGEKLNIYSNYALNSLTGLEGVVSIGSDLRITFNETLTNLTGLEGINSIGGYLWISTNNGLSSLTGVDNIDPNTISAIHIVGNPLLSTCDVQSVCGFLANPTGGITIHWNAPGCDSPEEVEEVCESHCLFEGITFTTQTQIDSFQINYPNCTEIEGDINIFGDGENISNLAGLNVLTAIGGGLKIGSTNIANLIGLDGLTTIGDDVAIYPNDSLASLTGLENLTTIAGELALGRSSPGGIEGNPSLLSLEGLSNLVSVEALNITWCGSLSDLTGLENITSIGDIVIAQNNSLTSLSGLNNLTSVNGNLTIGFISGTGWGGGNPSLTNITALINLNVVGGDLAIIDNNSLPYLYGLNNITSINGDLDISYNFALTSLNGLDNIEPGSITDLFIRGNTSLSTCNVESICEYLVSPNGQVYISGNATGCGSQQEVMDSCIITSTNEIKYEEPFTISPNPLGSNTLITYTLENSSSVTLKILDSSGRLVVSLLNEYQHKGEQRVILNTEGLKPGVYFCTLKTNNSAQTKKVIKL